MFQNKKISAIFLLLVIFSAVSFDSACAADDEEFIYEIHFSNMPYGAQLNIEYPGSILRPYRTELVTDKPYTILQEKYETGAVKFSYTFLGKIDGKVEGDIRIYFYIIGEGKGQIGINKSESKAVSVDNDDIADIIISSDKINVDTTAPSGKENRPGREREGASVNEVNSGVPPIFFYNPPCPLYFQGHMSKDRLCSWIYGLITPTVLKGNIIMPYEPLRSFNCMHNNGINPSYMQLINGYHTKAELIQAMYTYLIRNNANPEQIASIMIIMDIYFTYPLP
ncbi:MAG: hypothetical protein QME46_08680 [Thermoanaerobacteraceae bacterium]|nr:hypothetical protein [Thermoanaerobacteraceae bacterium]